MRPRDSHDLSIMLKQFIELLSIDLELSNPLSPEKDGSYLLLMEPELQISLRENSESGITLFTKLGPLPEKNVEEFLQYVMSANLLGKETGGNILGLEREEKNVTLTGLLPAQITYKNFHHLLEDFMNYAESWQLETRQFIKK